MNAIKHWMVLPCISLVGLMFANLIFGTARANAADETQAPPAPKILAFPDADTVDAALDGQIARLQAGQHLGHWTLMAVIAADKAGRQAVFEDFFQPNGRLIFADQKGLHVQLPKSSEPTFAAPASLYLGHQLDEVMNSDRDLLGDSILAKAGDPTYDLVASCFPPIAKMRTYTFVGTPDCFEKVGFTYEGSSPNFDPVAYVPALEKVRANGRVSTGLVGGWLPVIRYVYPESTSAWTEMIAYAPMRIENENNRVQPVWYRVSRIEKNELQWARYFDSYHPFPPRTHQPAPPFYEQLLAMREGWNRLLEPAMKIVVPDQRLADMAHHSLVRDLMTRIGPFPKYGVFDRGYGGSEHDGFPDTFNVDTTAMLAWGCLDLARAFIDNYFDRFVRDDGSILYRGPETGQFGRMLTVVAQYAEYTGDDQLLLRHRSRIDGVTRLLLDLRQLARSRPLGDPAYGMIAGWSEADACLDPEPTRYMQPYFSNSTEAERGFRDLGRVWVQIGQKRQLSELTAWGQKLMKEAEALAKDIQTAIEKSVLKTTQPMCLPAIAGADQPFDIAVARDHLDPQFRSYRAYMEMLYSGNLTREQVSLVTRYRAAHRDTILGIPTAYGYNTHEWAGFLTYGHAYGLLQHDSIREFLLTLYSIMAHQYTRGTWTAPETRNINPKQFAAPYCTPAQMVVPLMTRWMLVFEDPQSGAIWLAKGTPRIWLAEGQTFSITNAPIRHGRLSYSISSHLPAGKVDATVELPDSSLDIPVILRLRVPEGNRIKSVTINDQAWSQFDAETETVRLPIEAKGKVMIQVNYR